MRYIDITGQTFGRLTAISSFQRRDDKGRAAIYWVCKCTCGNTAKVAGSPLRRGLTVSCGCWMRESQKLRATKHGDVGKRLYTIWSNMLARCENKNHPMYKNYGGRGIAVCNAWHTYEQFRADVGHPPSKEFSLDRIDNDGNYEPGNTRWATAKTQARNKRQNVFVEIDGKKLCVADAAEQYGVDYDRLHSRLFELGWPAEKALGLHPRKFDGTPVAAPRER